MWKKQTLIFFIFDFIIFEYNKKNLLFLLKLQSIIQVSYVRIFFKIIKQFVPNKHKAGKIDNVFSFTNG